MNGMTVTRVVVVAALVSLCVAVAPVFAADPGSSTPDLFKRGNQWISLRAGYAKTSDKIAAAGFLGYGFGYSRFVIDKWAVGAFVQHDALGHSGDAVDIEVPFTLEVVRHTQWGAALYPYVGIGLGAYYGKRYRTGQDESGFQPGRYVTLGARTPIRRQGLLGVDVRVASLDKPDDNPVFAGPPPDRYHVDELLNVLRQPWAQTGLMLFNDTESKTRTVWSVKLEYTYTY